MIKTMKLIATLLLASWVGLAQAQIEDIDAHTGTLHSLQGDTPLQLNKEPVRLKDPVKDQGIQDRQYMHQPPLIPHQVRGYEVDLKVNRCLSCHGWKNAASRNAPRVSVTHFEPRDGMTLSDISPRRYFCMQCHVPQTDAKPLVENTFTPVESLR